MSHLRDILGYTPLDEISYNAPAEPPILLGQLTLEESKILGRMWQLNAIIPITASRREINYLGELNRKGQKILAEAKRQTQEKIV